MTAFCVIPILLLLVQFAGPSNGDYGRYMLPITAFLPIMAGMLLKLRNQADGIRYILSMVEKHGELARRIYGLHFHQSVSGAYCRKVIGKLPEDFPREYLPAFGYSYPHIERIDRHHPWTNPECVRILNRVEPKYLTHEISSGLKRPQLKAVGDQLRVIAKGNVGR